MAVYMTRSFERFASRNAFRPLLTVAASDVAAGNFDADLGGGVYKQRVARPGKGRSGGFRVLLIHRTTEHVFFVHGFAKNEKGNITSKELAALKAQAKQFASLSAAQLHAATVSGALIEVTDGDEDP